MSSRNLASAPAAPATLDPMRELMPMLRQHFPGIGMVKSRLLSAVRCFIMILICFLQRFLFAQGTTVYNCSNTAACTSVAEKTL